MIRVLVAEDSTTTRELLVFILRSDPQIEVIGEAKDGLEALAMTRKLGPDVVTMDIRMPMMDGFEATKQIMIEAPTPIVIVSGSLDAGEVAVTIHALRAGALAVIRKPVGPGSPAFEEESRQLLSTVKAMSQVKVVRHWPERPRLQSRAAGVAERKHARGRVLAVAASTGGPAALQFILSALPGNLSVPILIVQHMAGGFVEGLAAWLNTACPLKVKVAEDGETLAPHTAYLAPDSRHLGVSARSTVLLSDAPPIGGFRPSATFLFESIARVFGASAVGVVLTGMGEDGVEGLRAVRNAGGRVIAQDEASSVVFGMPGAAIDARLAHMVLPLSSVAPRLIEMVG